MESLILVPLLLLVLTLVLAAARGSIFNDPSDQIGLEVKGKKKPSRDRFPDNTQPGTAAGGAIEDRSDDETDNV